MSWTARITKAPDGELRLAFSEPLKHIDLDRETACQLAAVLVVAAEGMRSKPLEADHETGVLNTELAENSHERLTAGAAQPKTSQTYPGCFMTENKPKRLGLLFGFVVLPLLVVACGGTVEPNACPHRTYQFTDAAGSVTMRDNTPEQDKQICDYLAWLNANPAKGANAGEAGAAGAEGQP